MGCMLIWTAILIVLTCMLGPWGFAAAVLLFIGVTLGGD
jgi:hypothetical protein